LTAFQAFTDHPKHKKKLTYTRNIAHRWFQYVILTRDTQCSTSYTSIQHLLYRLQTQAATPNPSLFLGQQPMAVLSSVSACRAERVVCRDPSSWMDHLDRVRWLVEWSFPGLLCSTISAWFVAKEWDWHCPKISACTKCRKGCHKQAGTAQGRSLEMLQQHHNSPRPLQRSQKPLHRSLKMQGQLSGKLRRI